MVQNYNVEHVKLHFSWACFKKPATLKKNDKSSYLSRLAIPELQNSFPKFIFFQQISSLETYLTFYRINPRR